MLGIEIDPEDSYAYYNLGNAYSLIGKCHEAIKHYDESIKLKQDFHSVYYNKGNELYIIGRKEEAIEIYDKAIGVNSSKKDPYFEKGYIIDRLR